MQEAARYVLPHTLQEPRFVRVTESGVSRSSHEEKKKYEVYAASGYYFNVLDKWGTIICLIIICVPPLAHFTSLHDPSTSRFG